MSIKNADPFTGVTFPTWVLFFTDDVYLEGSFLCSSSEIEGLLKDRVVFFLNFQNTIFDENDSFTDEACAQFCWEYLREHNAFFFHPATEKSGTGGEIGGFSCWELEEELGISQDILPSFSSRFELSLHGALFAFKEFLKKK
jgi:hypothetical protein